MKLYLSSFSLGAFLYQTHLSSAWTSKHSILRRTMPRSGVVMSAGGTVETREDSASTNMRYLTGIEDMAKDHEVFLLDMWGVMHDGSTPYEGVLETVQKLKDAGKKLVILSNSSKRRDNSVKMLHKLGFDPNDFDQIITSGEVAYRMLAGDETLECETWSTLSEIRKDGVDSRKVFVFGSGAEDEEYCTSSGWTLAPMEEANLILARGTFTINDGTGNVVKKTEDEGEYFRVLQKSLEVAASRKIPMLVSNPDKVRPDKGLPPMPGAIGDAYESKLEDGEREDLVKRIGKPFKEVYDLALCDHQSDPSIACMVGDALETDVTGGSRVGCTTVWVVKDGIHGPAIMEKGSGSHEPGSVDVLKEFNVKDGTYAEGSILSPDICLPHFRW
jgi:HAD superfamily hydrolase (TIGR01450 family)